MAAADQKASQRSRRKSCPTEEKFCGDWFEGWTLFPKDASGDMKLSPISSTLCTVLSWMCLVFFCVVHIFFEYSEIVPCARHTMDPSITAYFNINAKMGIAALCREVFWFVCVRFMGFARLYRSEKRLRKRLRINLKMIFVTGVFACIYNLLTFDLQIVHSGARAGYHGGTQLVYSVRYIEWALSSAFIVTACGHIENDAESGAPRNGLVPSGLLTSMYCITAWQGLVVKNQFVGWTLIIFSLLCYFAASAEQLIFAWHIKGQEGSGPVKCFTLVVVVVLLAGFGTCFLLPIPGMMPTTLENKLYCFGDLIWKVGVTITIVVTEDVWALTQMRQERDMLADNLRSLIYNASVPIVSVNRDGDITEFNKKASELLRRVSDKGVVGLSLYEMIRKEDRASCQKMVHDALSLEGTSSAVVSIPLPQTDAGEGEGPSSVVLELLASRRADSESGEIVGATLIGHDITILKEAEDRKMLFMRNMSHELRSPLHGMISLAEHLATEETIRERSRSLQMILNCSKRLLGLVVDIMDMATMAAEGNGVRQQVLHKERVDLSKIVEEVVTLVKRSSDKVGRKLLKPGVKLINAFGRDLEIEADAAKCHQVFFNLVINACKFTNQGVISISSKVVAGGEWVEVIVTDTGTGISRENIERIFNPFEQEDNSSGRAHEGLGLGLAIAHQIVQMHGGQIRVASEVGVGSTFFVRLPMQAQLAREGPQENPVMEVGEAIQHLKSIPHARHVSSHWSLKEGGQTILSVDDGEVNQNIMENLLGREYRLVKAMDGAQACDYLKANPMPDVLLLGMMMPGMTGLDVLRVIRQDWNIAPLELPILVISAHDSPDRVVEAMKLGCNEYIGKPFDGKVLQAQVRVALQARSMYCRSKARSGTDATAEVESQSSNDDHAMDLTQGLRNRRSAPDRG